MISDFSYKTMKPNHVILLVLIVICSIVSVVENRPCGKKSGGGGAVMLVPVTAKGGKSHSGMASMGGKDCLLKKMGRRR